MIITIVITFTSNDVFKGKARVLQKKHLFVSGGSCNFSNGVDYYFHLDELYSKFIITFISDNS